MPWWRRLTGSVVAANDGRHFRSGRDLAAWIGLVPRLYTTGSKPKLGDIDRRANHHLRRRIVHGARALACFPLEPRPGWLARPGPGSRLGYGAVSQFTVWGEGSKGWSAR
jgi:Transposase IS116/IS110/IS902 family